MPTKSPTVQEIRIARDAADYRNHMFGVFQRRGLSEREALLKAAEVADAQIAMRMQELAAKLAAKTNK